MQTYREEAGWSSPTWPAGAKGDPTRWHYEEATGLLASKEDAAGKAVTYTYGPAGRLATRTWARKKPDGGALRTTYAYDSATSELRKVDYNDDTPDVTYTYDRLGRQSMITDAVGTRVFAYDAQTLQLKTETIEGPTPAVLTKYYDPVTVKGRRIGLSLGDHYTVGYGFDQAGRMQSVAWTANGQSDTALYSRTTSSELLSGYATQSGFSTAYLYEPHRDLKTQVANRWGGNVVSQYDYRYDMIGRRASVENSGSTFGSAKSTSWGYDERNEVRSSNRYAGSFTASPNLANEIAPERRNYSYDSIGNRESALEQDGSTLTNYQANKLNQYDAVGQQALVYDEDGNLLNDGTKVLTYNAENQLKSVTVPGVSVSTYDYDYMGRRVRKSVHGLDRSSSDYVITWVYDGWNAVQESKSVDGAAAAVKSFVWGLDLSQSLQGAGGIGALLTVVDASGASLFTYDGNGNVSELVAANGSGMSAHYEYDAFGNVVLASGSGAAENCYRFSTKEQDDETGLVYYGYRYYDGVTGRWVNRDPAKEEGGLNLFLFALNQAAATIDPLGSAPAPACPPPPPVPPRDQRQPLNASDYPENPAFVTKNDGQLITSTSPAPGQLAGRIQHSVAIARWGAIDTSKIVSSGAIQPRSEKEAAWPNAPQWIINLRIPAVVRNDPSYTWKRNGVLIDDVDMNKDMAPKFEQALNNLASRHLLCELRTVGSEWHIRKSTGSSKYVSFHAWGAAIDINPGSNEHYAVPTMSQPFVRAFMDTGLTWGGLWPDEKLDGMHFSLGW